MTGQDIQYPTKIEVKSEFIYNFATREICSLAKVIKLIDGKKYYYLDDAKTQVVRTDLNITKPRTIELSDKVDEEIKKRIESILN